MWNTKLFLVVTVFIVGVLFSCNRKNESGGTRLQKHKSNLDESLVNANIKTVRTEETQIADFIARYKWNMTRTGTGLQYQVYKHGNGGNNITDGDYVVIKYSTRLINGVEIYNSNELGVKEFIAGRGTVESGLEEALLFMKQGDKAHIVIPSYLAHGLAGDGDKIPPKATIIYDIEIINVESSK